MLLPATPPTREQLETLTEQLTWLAKKGDDGTRLFNFWEATQGKASLKVDGLLNAMK